MSRRIIFPFIIVTVLAFLGATVQTAQALQCGDTITTDTTLTADLGPCPADGLIIQGNNLTLNLNGHKITGSAIGNGVTAYGIDEITIKGPGRITKCAAGIAVSDAGNVTVYGVTFTGNQTGVSVVHNINPAYINKRIRIVGNKIVGTNQTGTGINIDWGSIPYVYQNTIMGNSVGVEVWDEVGAIIDENLITLNRTGIVVVGGDFVCYSIRGNLLVLNQGDGIRNYGGLDMQRATSSFETCSLGNIIEDNTVTSNAGSGILVGQLFSVTLTVQDNEVSLNKGNGIAVMYGLAPVQVIGNVTSRNGTDLYVDPQRTNVCGQQNIVGTSSVPQFQECQ